MNRNITTDKKNEKAVYACVNYGEAFCPGEIEDRVKFCPPGIYTIVAVSDGAGARSWGKLKRGIGWIALEYTVRL